MSQVFPRLNPGLAVAWRARADAAAMPSRAKIASLITVIALGGLAAVAFASGNGAADPAAVQTQDDQPRTETRTEVVRQTVHRRAKAESSPSGGSSSSSSRPAASSSPSGGGGSAPATAAATPDLRGDGTVDDHGDDDRFDDHGGDRDRGGDDDSGHGRGRGRGGDDDSDDDSSGHGGDDFDDDSSGHGGGDDDNSGHGGGGDDD